MERTRIQSLEQQFIQHEQRITRLNEEQQRQSSSELEAEIAERLAKVEESSLQTSELQERLQTQQQAIQDVRETTHQLSSQLDEQRSQLQSMKGRHSSLEALQQAALGKADGEVAQWLSNNNLDQAQRLAQGLKVAEGWERAVECVLGFHLESVCVDGLDSTANQLANPDFLQVGMQLVIPVGGLIQASATLTPAPTPTDTPIPFEPPSADMTATAVAALGVTATALPKPPPPAGELQVEISEILGVGQVDQETVVINNLGDQQIRFHRILKLGGSHPISCQNLLVPTDIKSPLIFKGFHSLNLVTHLTITDL